MEDKKHAAEADEKDIENVSGGKIVEEGYGDYKKYVVYDSHGKKVRECASKHDAENADFALQMRAIAGSVDEDLEFFKFIQGKK